MGFIVGCVIVYQILYSDVSDHLPEYATLLAMGYKLRDLIAVVAREGLFLAVLGYIPAYVSGECLYHLVRISTQLPVAMNPSRGITVFFLILIIVWSLLFYLLWDIFLLIYQDKLYML